MVKGCQKRIIVVNNTGSRYFDAAYFIVRNELPQGSSDRDMLREAQSIVDACSVEQMFTKQENAAFRTDRKKRQKSGGKGCDGLIAYLSGAATVGFVIGAIAIAANLLY